MAVAVGFTAACQLTTTIPATVLPSAAAAAAAACLLR